MSEKPVVERILKHLENRLDVDGKSGSWLTPPEAHLLLDGIREMQEEIEQDKKVMLEAVEFIEKGKEGDAWRIIVDLLAKHQPKDNGAGGEG